MRRKFRKPLRRFLETRFAETKKISEKQITGDLKIDAPLLIKFLKEHGLETAPESLKGYNSRLEGGERYECMVKIEKKLLTWLYGYYRHIYPKE